MSPESHYLIYVIDDDDLVRDGLCSLLEHLGHRTHSFRHPEVALQALLAAEVPPEVVIVDYNMPGMNGAQFIGRYSTAVSGTPRVGETQLLLMSGLPPSHFQDFMSEFAELKLGVLEKPFTLDTLRKRLATIQVARQKNIAKPLSDAAVNLQARTTPLAKPEDVAAPQEQEAPEKSQAAA